MFAQLANSAQAYSTINDLMTAASPSSDGSYDSPDKKLNIAACDGKLTLLMKGSGFLSPEITITLRADSIFGFSADKYLGPKEALTAASEFVAKWNEARGVPVELDKSFVTATTTHDKLCALVTIGHPPISDSTQAWQTLNDLLASENAIIRNPDLAPSRRSITLARSAKDGSTEILLYFDTASLAGGPDEITQLGVTVTEDNAVTFTSSGGKKQTGPDAFQLLNDYLTTWIKSASHK